MPNINLIAARREEKKKVETLTRQLFLALVASGCVFVLVTLFVSGRELAAHAALRKAEKEWATVQPKLKRIEELRKQEDALSPRVETLQQAKVETSRWRAVMLSISQAMPSEAWLSGMSTSGGGEDMIINLTGTTSSNSMVGETMHNLGQQPVFDGVELHIATLIPPQPGDLTQRYTFDMGVHLKPAVALSMNKDKDKDSKDATQKADAGAGNGGNKNG